MNSNWPIHFSPPIIGRGLGSGGLSSYVIALEAWRRGLDVTFKSDDLRLYTISSSSTSIDFDFSLPRSITSVRTQRVLDRKSETNSLLKRVGVPVPSGVLLETAGLSLDVLRQHAEDISFPIAVKPNVGSTGRGVHAGLKNWEELRGAYLHLIESVRPDKVLLEKHIYGDDHRILVVGNEVVGVARKIAAHVLGNGSDTISELIAAKNVERRRNPFLSTGLIKVDYEVTQLLDEQGMTLKSVPREGEKIELRRIASGSAGGENVDVTFEVPEPVKAAAVRAVRSFPEIMVAGVDVIFDADSPSISDSYVILEINPRPHIGVNMYPSEGRGRDAPSVILDRLFPNSNNFACRRSSDVRFNEKTVRAALRSGSVSSVSLSPVPEDGFPARSVTLLEGWAEVGSAVRRIPQVTIQKAAADAGVSGVLRRSTSGGLELAVAGARESVNRRFLQDVCRLLGARPGATSRWRGPVTAGFVVTI